MEYMAIASAEMEYGVKECWDAALSMVGLNFLKIFFF